MFQFGIFATSLPYVLFIAISVLYLVFGSTTENINTESPKQAIQEHYVEKPGNSNQSDVCFSTYIFVEAEKIKPTHIETFHVKWLTTKILDYDSNIYLFQLFNRPPPIG